MAYFSKYGMLRLANNGAGKLQTLHGSEGRVQALANVLIWWVRELVNQADDGTVSREPFIKKVILIYMAGKPARAFDLYAIIENSHMHIVCNRVVTMKYCVCDDLVQGFWRVLDRLKAMLTKYAHLLDYLLRLRH